MQTRSSCRSCPERAALLLGLALLSGAAGAATFAVTPIRVDLASAVQSGSVTVVNNDTVAIGFEMKLLRWTQDARGEDAYEDSSDLVYFPRLMSVEPDDRRVVRVGLQGPPGATEQAYRLAIDEMSPPRKGDSAQVAIRIRFAVPVFVAPREPKASFELKAPFVKDGELRFRIVNTGNQHLKIEEARLVKGDQELASGPGAYLLAGAQREFGFKLGKGACGSAATLVLKGENIDVRRDVAAALKNCGQ